MITPIYLDTNVYNRIADKTPPPILPGTFSTQWAAKIYLSPLNILEILQIENDLRRETIVRILQEICAPNMLAEPEALLVDFIAERTKNDSLKHLRLESPFSTSDLSFTWRDIKANPAKTFIFTDAVRRKIRYLKLLSQCCHAWQRSGGGLNNDLIRNLGNYGPLSSGQFESTMRQAIEALKLKTVSRTKPWPINDLILILSTCVLALELTPFPESINNLWKALGISDTKERISYVVTGPMKFVLSEGPLIGMAGIMASQVAKTFSPGNFLDAFHITYLPYISELLTFDETLLSFTGRYPKSENFTKVHHANSLICEILQHSPRHLT